jgi:hypothetical protein
MTTLGKILVIGVVVLSVSCLGYALAVFGSQQVLTPPPPAADNSKGSSKPANLHVKQYTERSERDARAKDDLVRAKLRWVDATKELASVEKAYNSHPEFYRAELAALDDGDGDMQGVLYDGDAAVKLDNQIHGRVVMVPVLDESGQAIKSHKTYPPLIAAEYKKLAEMSKELAGDPTAADIKKKVGLFRWHEGLTRLLYEELPNEDPGARGLRVDLAIEQFKKAQLEKELEYLDEVKSRLSVDNESLVKRRDQMEARKKELEEKLKGK